MTFRSETTNYQSFAMLRFLVFLAVLLSAINCRAEQVRIACLFDRPIAVPDMDAEAKSLSYGFQATNMERVVLLQLKPPKMLNSDSLFRLFPDGPIKVEVSDDQVLVAWHSNENPRKPAMNLTVNRFSLEATEYFQIKKLTQGNDVFSWTRSGKCKVDSRKF